MLDCKDLCPYCGIWVSPRELDRKQTATFVAHASCHEQAKLNARGKNEHLSNLQNSGKRLDDGIRQDRRNRWPRRTHRLSR